MRELLPISQTRKEAQRSKQLAPSRRVIGVDAQRHLPTGEPILSTARRNLPYLGRRATIPPSKKQELGKLEAS